MKFIHRIFAVMLFVLSVCSSGLAQGTDASLSGVVTDPSHAAISGAKVTASNKSTNFAQEVTTDTNGTYSFLNLPIGTYSVIVEQSGFRKTSVDVILETAQKARQDI